MLIVSDGQTKRTGSLMGISIAPRSSQSVPIADTASFRDMEVGDLAVRYREAEPGPHIALDGLFPEEVLQRVCDEISAIEIDPEKNVYSAYLKHRISDPSRLPPTARRLIEDLNSADFLGFLERLTGIEGLIPDPYLEGGGIHQIGTGGYLKIPRISITTRAFGAPAPHLCSISTLAGAGMGGAIGFGRKRHRCQGKLFALVKRRVLFSTTTILHGHPDPRLAGRCRRNSIALYYYTADRPDDEVRSPNRP